MFTRKQTKEEVKLWRIIFDLRETIANMSQQIDRYAIRQNKVINMHQPHGANNSVCSNCSQRYPCQTIHALKP
jgi:hypothetical protein